MKSEPRPFASLSSGLLARKGAARPAMRPQGFGQMGSGLDDLGWNDMGFEPPKPSLATVEGEEAVQPRTNPVTGLTPASPVHAVQEEIVQRLGNEADEEEVDETAEPVPADVPPLAEVLAMPVRTRAFPTPPEFGMEEAEEPFEPAPFEPAPIEIVAEVPAAPIVVLVPAPTAEPTPTPKPAAKPAAKVKPRARRAANGTGKAAFTLRLDGDRHLKLRLACAITGTSAQQLVTRALDALLGTMPEVDAMAERASERTASKG